MNHRPKDINCQNFAVGHESENWPVTSAEALSQLWVASISGSGLITAYTELSRICFGIFSPVTSRFSQIEFALAGGDRASMPSWNGIFEILTPDVESPFLEESTDGKRWRLCATYRAFNAYRKSKCCQNHRRDRASAQRLEAVDPSQEADTATTCSRSHQCPSTRTQRPKHPLPRRDDYRIRCQQPVFHLTGSFPTHARQTRRLRSCLFESRISDRGDRSAKPRTPSPTRRQLSGSLAGREPIHR